jgi:hypothetical protein
MRQLKGENPSDESSPEEEEEEKTTSSLQGDEVEEDVQLLPIMSPSLSMAQPTYIFLLSGQVWLQPQDSMIKE